MHNPFDETHPCEFEYTSEVRLMFEQGRALKEVIRLVLREELDRTLSKARQEVSCTPVGPDDDIKYVAVQTVLETLDSIVEQISLGEDK
jgi:hypothetical protein